MLTIAGSSMGVSMVGRWSGGIVRGLVDDDRYGIVGRENCSTRRSSERKRTAINGGR